ncbi:MAG: D-alanine--D-alanine ligase [Lachnospiraceae bacterium]|nr:D-alanine--D-alanine ligase [Lachnospiraceae bacterium]
MKIVVIAGGNSTERDVSLVSGTGVYRALKQRGHEVVLLDVYLGVKDVDTDNVFADNRDWAEGIMSVKEKNPDLKSIQELKGADTDFFGENVIEICKKADMVFMALHGANGEDGRIQAAFDLMGIRYTGTDYLSSAICMDKAITKEFLIMNQVPTPKSETVYRGEEYVTKAETIGFPLVAKVCNGGSSVGVSIVEEKSQLEHAMEDSFQYGDKVLLEQFIKGREFTCGVIEGRALPVVEIEPKSGFYDYKNKYQAGSTIETCPAKIPDAIREAIQRETEHAFRALRLKTYARIDFLMDEEENIYCLEANTLPGMTPTSLLPQEAACEGMDYPALCEHIIEISMKKYRRGEKNA